MKCLLVLAAYFLGAVPFGLLIAHAKGVDIRQVGSGNIGATNVFRTVNKTAGLSALVLDALKGFIPAFLFPSFVGVEDPRWGLFYGIAAIAGHNWPVYLRFKGGKGVATSAGVLVGLTPLAALVGLVIWTFVLLGTGYVAVASIGAAIIVPTTAWLLYPKPGFIIPVTLTALGLLVIWRHRANIQRLRAGTEHKFSFGRRNENHSHR